MMDRGDTAGDFEETSTLPIRHPYNWFYPGHSSLLFYEWRFVCGIDCVCVCKCVCGGDRERERESGGEAGGWRQGKKERTIILK